jgi:hypothetical protein
MKSALQLSALALVLASPWATAKPIAYARGKTVMVEYGAGTMNEAQAFYAPNYWSSVGVGWTELKSEDGSIERKFTYLRGNLLAHRWNLPAAQANVFVWGGLGRASGTGIDGELSREVGAQFDFETRRVYASLKTDLQETGHSSNRVDTLQLGWAPYAHDYETLATWIVLQGRTYTGGIASGTETALLLRLFKGGAWVEAGVTTDRQLQAMAMFNF